MSPTAGQMMYREARPDEASAIAELWNRNFPPISASQYAAQRDHTTIVAVGDDVLYGAIPFQFRPLVVVPGVVVRAAYAHGVGVLPGLNGRGIGSQMMASARELLKTHCDAMLVYTGNEDRAPYTFYARTEHYDLHYAPSWKSVGTGHIPLTTIVGHPLSALKALEPQLLALFDSTYRLYGGYWPRLPGFYARALASIIYTELPYSINLLTLGDESAAERPLECAGYAIVGELNDRLDVLEIATHDGDSATAGRLLSHIGAVAQRGGRRAEIVASTLHPFCSILRSQGWEATARGGGALVTAGHVLRPDTLARRLWRGSPDLDRVEVQAWTPDSRAVLHAVDGNPRESVTLEMKEETLHRLLLGRLDLAAAFTDERVTAHACDEQTRALLSSAFPFAPWVHHTIEYI